MTAQAGGLYQFVVLFFIAARWASIPAHRSPKIFSRTRGTVKRAISFSVSKTPRPSMAAASRKGAAGIKEIVQGFHGNQIVQIPLVILEDQRHQSQIDFLLLEIPPQAFQAFQVGVEERDLGIGHENQSVGPDQDVFPGRFVINLAGTVINWKLTLKYPI